MPFTPCHVGGSLVAALAITCLGIDPMISASTGKAVAEYITGEPKPVALLLGTARTHQGQPNQFYRARIEAAAELFHSGRVRGILVSGDNATGYYNEPVAMQKDLIAVGVPPEFVRWTTPAWHVDSVVRAKEVFGATASSSSASVSMPSAPSSPATSALMPTASPPPTPRLGLMKVRAREVLARVAAVLDIVIGREPKFLDAPETVRLRDDAQQSNSA